MFLHISVPIHIHKLDQGELAHRLVKRLYGLTNKKDAIKQISKKYSRQQSFRNAERQEEKEAETSGGHLEHHHVISRSRNIPLNLFSFIQTDPSDPAKKVKLLASLFSLVAAITSCRILFQNCKIIS